MQNNREKKENDLIRLVESFEESAQLRRTLNVIFPSSYIELYHCKNLFDPKLLETRIVSNGENDIKWEASSEPSVRNRVVDLIKSFDLSLVENQAKPIGLCAIRRSIYDQCFDELIRQTTVGCIEQGLLLYRIRNELKMTMSYYRRAYESAIAFNASKMLRNMLEFEEDKKLIGELEARLKQFDDMNFDEKREKSKDNREDSDLINRTREYYESEMAKKDQIIKRQRNMIEALSQKSIEQIENPL